MTGNDELACERRSDAEDVLFEEEREENGKSSQDGEHGEREAFGGTQTEHEITDVY